MISVVSWGDESGHTSSRMGVESRRAPIIYKVQHQILSVSVWSSVSQDVMGLGWTWCLYFVTPKRLGSCGIYANQVKHCLRAGSVGLGRCLIFNVLADIMG